MIILCTDLIWPILFQLLVPSKESSMVNITLRKQSLVGFTIWKSCRSVSEKFAHFHDKFFSTHRTFPSTSLLLSHITFVTICTLQDLSKLFWRQIYLDSMHFGRMNAPKSVEFLRVAKEYLNIMGKMHSKSGYMAQFLTVRLHVVIDVLLIVL